MHLKVKAKPCGLPIHPRLALNSPVSPTMPRRSYICTAVGCRFSCRCIWCALYLQVSHTPLLDSSHPGFSLVSVLLTRLARPALRRAPGAQLISTWVLDIWAWGIVMFEQQACYRLSHLSWNFSFWISNSSPKITGAWRISTFIIISLL